MREFCGGIGAAGWRMGQTLAVLVGLSLVLGCNSAQVALGVRTRLADLPVAALKAFLPKGPALGPGESSPLVVVATMQDGTELATEGEGHGTVLWDSFEIQGNLATVDEHGVVTLSPDPRESEDRPPRLRILTKGHPEAVTELDLPVRYDRAFLADFSGKPGSDGTRGREGLSGRTGSAGSTITGHLKAGGRGSSGGDGTSGGNGGRGEPGKAVQIWVTMKSGAHPLLQVLAVAGGREQRFLVDPQGGSLLVKSDGGAGGAGGPGGRGGQGGNGGMGWPSGSRGLAGHSGRNGMGGAGGDGGSIHVTVDPQARPFLGAIRFSNCGGSPGGQAGPAPVIREEAIGTLW